MVIELGKVKIDTELDHKAHKEAIQEVTSFFCDTYDPVQWFTQMINGYQRFYQLHYNKSGDVLQKITSWDKKKDHERNTKWIKRRIGSNDDCYFSKNNKDAEYELVQEIDTSDISHPNITHWNRSWGDKKRWKFF